MPYLDPKYPHADGFKFYVEAGSYGAEACTQVGVSTAGGMLSVSLDDEAMTQLILLLSAERTRALEKAAARKAEKQLQEAQRLVEEAAAAKKAAEAPDLHVA